MMEIVNDYIDAVRPEPVARNTVRPEPVARNTVRPEPVARNTVRPEPVEGQGGVAHASTSSARTAKVLDQKKLTDLVERQVMRSYFDKFSTSGAMA